MEAANRTFISSTFWTERIGPAAALAALETMEAEEAPARVFEIGQQVRTAWLHLLHGLGLSGDVSGMPALSAFNLQDRDGSTIKAFVAHEMLQHGFLAGNAEYSSIAHTPEVQLSYLEALGPTLEAVAQNSDEALRRRLPRGPAVPPFGRLA
jgi:glutamate-1-semialdehyde 2,1-aminomutase